MDRSTAESTQKSQPGGQTVRRSGKRAAIVLAVGIAVVLAAAAVAARLAVETERPGKARGDGCASKAANDSHFIFEAFFQNPPERNALAQIADVCGK